MKITTIKSFTIVFLAVIFANISIANASNIGVVDLESVLKNCDAMKDAQSKISKKQGNFQKEIDREQTALEKESKKVAAKKGVLSEEAFNKEQDKFSKKVDDLKDLVSKRQDALKQSSLEVIATVNDKIKEVIDEVREAKNLDVVLSSGSTVFYKDNLDISAEVLKKLNKKISKVEVK